MTATTPAPTAGWYPDTEPGRLRWHDGTRWTADTMPVPPGASRSPAGVAAATTPSPVAPTPPGLLAPGLPAAGAPAARGIGMSWWSVAAVFLAVLTLVLWGLSLLTGLVGVAAIAREKRQGTGQVLFGALAVGAAVAGRLLARATHEPTLLAWF